MKVVAFNGSPRREGNTALLLNTVLEVLAGHGIKTKLVQVGGQHVWGCQACMTCRKLKNRRCANDRDPLNGWLEKLFSADGVLLGSPTYFSDLTPELKALIDRAGFVSRANGDVLRRKVGAAVVAVRRAGAVHAFDSINHFFTISQMIIPGSSYWNIGIGREAGEVQTDAEGMDTMRTLGENMAWLLAKLA